MDTVMIKGRLKFYLQTPLYMGILFLVGSLVLMKFDFRLGLIAGVASVIYGLIIYTSFKIMWKHLLGEIVNFAVQYGSVQNRLLSQFQIPYAVMDKEGKLLWMNEKFSELTGKDRRYRKSINSIFNEISRENLERAQAGNFTIQLSYNDKIFDAIMEKIPLSEDSESVVDKDSTRMIIEGVGEITSIMLIDVTERET